MGRPRTKASSRKTNRQPKHTSLLRFGLILIVIGLLMGGAALLFTPEQAAYIPDVLGAPRVAVAQEKVDFGDVQVYQYVEAVFHVRNVGDQVLRLLDNEPPIELVEGCCPPRAAVSSTTINPGEEATIRVKFTMSPGMDGPHDFRVHLRTNDPLEPEKELQILSNWVA